MTGKEKSSFERPKGGELMNLLHPDCVTTGGQPRMLGKELLDPEQITEKLAPDPKE